MFLLFKCPLRMKWSHVQYISLNLYLLQVQPSFWRRSWRNQQTCIVNLRMIYNLCFFHTNIVRGSRRIHTGISLKYLNFTLNNAMYEWIEGVQSRTYSNTTSVTYPNERERQRFAYLLIKQWRYYARLDKLFQGASDLLAIAHWFNYIE